MWLKWGKYARTEINNTEIISIENILNVQRYECWGNLLLYWNREQKVGVCWYL